mmetsp:Transcript_7814/g.9479  ORF Transcript_7814/g.9479 Transcript_7814/m.9479 type:complete len:170 (-) Transcript_7814:200-709(-)|eukprot:jgi/Bigna1/87505/estExt_fgenesh1_pg.C_210067
MAPYTLLPPSHTSSNAIVGRLGRFGKILALLSVGLVMIVAFSQQDRTPMLGGGKMVVFHPEGRYRVPTQIVEGAKGLTITCDLPGVKKEDVQLDLKEGRLTVKGERKMPNLGESLKPVHQETYMGKLSCAFDIPETIDTETIQAHFSNGVLTLTLFKKPEVQPKMIPIS